MVSLKLYAGAILLTVILVSFFLGWKAFIGIVIGFIIAASIVSFFPDKIILITSFLRADDLIGKDWIDEMDLFKNKK